MSEKMGALKIRIDSDLLRQLEELARRNERTTAGEARLAIREHLRLDARPELMAKAASIPPVQRGGHAT